MRMNNPKVGTKLCSIPMNGPGPTFFPNFQRHPHKSAARRNRPSVGPECSSASQRKPVPNRDDCVPHSIFFSTVPLPNAPDSWPSPAEQPVCCRLCAVHNRLLTLCSDRLCPYSTSSRLPLAVLRRFAFRVFLLHDLSRLPKPHARPHHPRLSIPAPHASSHQPHIFDPVPFRLASKRFSPIPAHTSPTKPQKHATAFPRSTRPLHRPHRPRRPHGNHASPTASQTRRALTRGPSTYALSDFPPGDAQSPQRAPNPPQQASPARPTRLHSLAPIRASVPIRNPGDLSFPRTPVRTAIPPSRHTNNSHRSVHRVHHAFLARRSNRSSRRPPLHTPWRARPAGSPRLHRHPPRRRRHPRAPDASLRPVRRGAAAADQQAHRAAPGAGRRGHRAKRGRRHRRGRPRQGGAELQRRRVRQAEGDHVYRQAGAVWRAQIERCGAGWRGRMWRSAAAKEGALVLDGETPPCSCAVVGRFRPC